MALFKISKGNEANLPKNAIEGHAYFTIDENNFYIDVETADVAVMGESRKQVNANLAVYAEAAAIIQDGEIEISAEQIAQLMQDVEDATSVAYNKTLAASAWTEAGEGIFTCAISLPELTCGSLGDIPPIISYRSNREEYSLITEAVADAGTGITFFASEKPAADIDIVIIDVK